METEQELIVKVYDNIFDMVEHVECLYEGSGKKFDRNTFITYFSLCCQLFCREQPNVICDKFFVNILVESICSNEESIVSNVVEKYRNECARFGSLLSEKSKYDGIKACVRDIVGEDFNMVTEELFIMTDAFPRIPSEDMISCEKYFQNANTIISVCIDEVEKAYSRSKKKFTLDIQSLYYAYYLSILLNYGLPYENEIHMFFDMMIKKLGVTSSTQINTIKFKFYNSLVKFRKYFKSHEFDKAVKACIRQIDPTIYFKQNRLYDDVSKISKSLQTNILCIF